MSNRSCQDCEWEKEGMICLQGHVRKMKGNLQERGHDPIENCHAWREKTKVVCWCQMEGERRLQLHDYVRDKWDLTHYQMRAPEIPTYCPVCSKLLGDKKGG